MDVVGYLGLEQITRTLIQGCTAYRLFQDWMQDFHVEGVL